MRSLSTCAFLSLLALALAACPQTYPAGGSGGPATGAGPATGTGNGAGPASGATDAPCTSAADCESGICEGLGCGPDEGRCAAASRGCTRDNVTYCGCDGTTFQSSGSCPGKRYASKGACEGGAPEKRADGLACTVAADCASGICEGAGCGPDGGVCIGPSTLRRCTRDLQTYCGCDGNEFKGSGTCPGQRYASRGSCDAGGGSAGTRVNLAVGAVCGDGSECASGICDGQGCGPDAGICRDKMRACTADIRQYCGCDGKTFTGSGSCPGRLYAKRGRC